MDEDGTTFGDIADGIGEAMTGLFDDLWEGWITEPIEKLSEMGPD